MWIRVNNDLINLDLVSYIKEEPSSKYTVYFVGPQGRYPIEVDKDTYQRIVTSLNKDKKLIVS